MSWTQPSEPRPQNCRGCHALLCGDCLQAPPGDSGPVPWLAEGALFPSPCAGCTALSQKRLPVAPRGPWPWGRACARRLSLLEPCCVYWSLGPGHPLL